MENTQIEYEFANKVLANYYQKDYPDYRISGDIKYEKRISEDAWGWDCEYYIFSGKLIIFKEVMILGEKVELKDTRLLHHDEIKKALIKALQDILGDDQYKIENVYPTKKYVGVCIKIKDKKLIKKDE